MIPLCARDLLEPLQGPLGVPGSYCYKLCMSGKMLENRLRFFFNCFKMFLSHYVLDMLDRMHVDSFGFMVHSGEELMSV